VVLLGDLASGLNAMIFRSCLARRRSAEPLEKLFAVPLQTAATPW
jgi:hypothetical protein